MEISLKRVRQAYLPMIIAIGMVMDLFETMKIANGNILLEEYHFERLFSGLETLKFKTRLSLQNKR